MFSTSPSWVNRWQFRNLPIDSLFLFYTLRLDSNLLTAFSLYLNNSSRIYVTKYEEPAHFFNLHGLFHNNLMKIKVLNSLLILLYKHAFLICTPWINHKWWNFQRQVINTLDSFGLWLDQSDTDGSFLHLAEKGFVWTLSYSLKFISWDFLMDYCYGSVRI